METSSLELIVTSEFQLIEIPIPPLAGPDGQDIPFVNKIINRNRCDPAEGGPKGDRA